MLQQEQEEYKREGIQWEHIDYFNNMVICQLIDESHKGIIAIMDEACLNVGKITDPMLLEEMDRKLAGHKHYNSRRFRFADDCDDEKHSNDKNYNALTMILKFLLHLTTAGLIFWS